MRLTAQMTDSQDTIQGELLEKENEMSRLHGEVEKVNRYSRLSLLKLCADFF